MILLQWKANTFLVVPEISIYRTNPLLAASLFKAVATVGGAACLIWQIFTPDTLPDETPKELVSPKSVSGKTNPYIHECNDIFVQYSLQSFMQSCVALGIVFLIKNSPCNVRQLNGILKQINKISF